MSRMLRHKRVAFFALLCFAPPAAASANPTWVVVEPPPALLDTPIYIYACSDPTCASQSQLEDNGYVTKVPTWQGTEPATWVFLETGGTDQ